MDTSDRREVFASERQQRIARIVEEHGWARVTDLAGRFHVSPVTIRKDLRVLETQGRVVRAHGGALAPNRSPRERAFEVRERQQREEKERIGAAAAALVIDGESIALDASTTALAMARCLKARGGWVHLTVITNGLRIASELAGHRGITVAMPGGFVRSEAMSVVGPLGAGLLERVNIQKAFIGAAGFTLETGLSDATDEEAQIKRLIVAAASEVVGLVDHTKWGRAAFATFCPTDRLTTVVTDDEPPAGMASGLRRRRVLLHVAPEPAKTPRVKLPTVIELDRAGHIVMSKDGPINAIENTDATSEPPPTALAGVSKRFAATQALADVSLALLAGGDDGPHRPLYRSGDRFPSPL